MAWFTAEKAVLLNLVHEAAETGLDEYVGQLAWALPNFLDRGGFWRELTLVQRDALRCARRSGDRTAEARACRTLASALASLGETDEAEEWLWRTLDLYAELGDRWGAANTELILAWVLEQQGRYRDALCRAQRALDHHTAIAQPTGRCSALNSIGWYHILLGEYEQGAARCREALDQLATTEGHYERANALDSLGLAHHHLGEYRQAALYLRQALVAFRDIGDRFLEATVLNRLGDTLHADDDPAGADEAWKLSSDVLEQLGHPDAKKIQAKLLNGT